MSFEDPDDKLPPLTEGGIYLSKHHTLYYEIGDNVSIVLPQSDRLRPKYATPAYQGSYGTSQIGAKGTMLGVVSFDTFKEIF